MPLDELVELPVSLPPELLEVEEPLEPVPLEELLELPVSLPPELLEVRATGACAA